VKERAKRPRPFLDEKIVTKWNAMLISGLISAYRFSSDKKYLDTAKSCLDFIMIHLQKDYDLWRSIKKGEKPSTIGFSDDYACLVQALLDLYGITLDQQYLNLAVKFQESLDRYFWDTEKGGYFISKESNNVIQLKDIQDGAEPSVQTVAYSNLMRLNLITKDDQYLEKAEKIISVYGGVISQAPQAVVGLSGLKCTDFRSISIHPEDASTVKSKLLKSTYPTVVYFDDKLKGFFVECKDNICLPKQPIDELR